MVRNSISFSRVSELCQLRWESLRVSRRLSGEGDTDCCSFECGFQVEVDNNSCGVSVAIDNVGHVFSTAIKFEETLYECHVQRLQSQFRDG